LLLVAAAVRAYMCRRSCCRMHSACFGGPTGGHPRHRRRDDGDGQDDQPE